MARRAELYPAGDSPRPVEQSWLNGKVINKPRMRSAVPIRMRNLTSLGTSLGLCSLRGSSSRVAGKAMTLDSYRRQTAFPQWW